MPTMGIGRFLLTLRACYTTASAKPTSLHGLRSVDTPQLYSCTNKSKTFPFIPDGITVGLAEWWGIEPHTDEFLFTLLPILFQHSVLLVGRESNPPVSYASRA